GLAHHNKDSVVALADRAKGRPTFADGDYERVAIKVWGPGGLHADIDRLTKTLVREEVIVRCVCPTVIEVVHDPSAPGVLLASGSGRMFFLESAGLTPIAFEMALKGSVSPTLAVFEGVPGGRRIPASLCGRPVPEVKAAAAVAPGVALSLPCSLPAKA